MVRVSLNVHDVNLVIGEEMWQVLRDIQFTLKILSNPGVTSPIGNAT